MEAVSSKATRIMDETNDDDALVQAFATDPAVFAELYDRYARKVYRYLYSRLGNASEAEELTSKVFLNVLEALPRYRPRGKFAAWLFAIVRRRVADSHRRERRNLPLEWLKAERGPHSDPLERVIQRQSLERLAELFNNLRDDKQELIRLRFAAGLSHREIGKILGRSEAAVAMSLHRLLRWLKEHWEVEHE